MKRQKVDGTRRQETRTDFKSKVGPDLSDLFNKSQSHPIAPSPDTTQRSHQPTMKPKAASGTASRRAMQDVEMTPRIADTMRSMDVSGRDSISDDQALQNAMAFDQPTTPQDLPAVMNKQLAAHGTVDPEWHMVKNLPGYLSSGIRAIGRAVFAPLTRTSIEDIQVLANIGGSGPNETREINAVAAYLQKNGKMDRDAALEFQGKIPGYSADIKVYKALGYTFVLVKDFAGHYIYSWPTSDSRSIETAAAPRASLESIKSVSFKEFLLTENQQ